jgi:hypothetical protein
VLIIYPTLIEYLALFNKALINPPDKRRGPESSRALLLIFGGISA